MFALVVTLVLSQSGADVAISAPAGADNIELEFVLHPGGQHHDRASRFEFAVGVAVGYQLAPDVEGIGPHLSARADFTEGHSRFSAVFWGHFLLPPDELVESFFPGHGYEHQLSFRYAYGRVSFGLESELRSLSHDGIRRTSMAALQLGLGTSLGVRLIDADHCFLDVHFAWMPAAIRVAGPTTVPVDLTDLTRFSASIDFAWRWLFAQAFVGSSRSGAAIGDSTILAIAGIFAGARLAW